MPALKRRTWSWGFTTPSPPSIPKPNRPGSSPVTPAPGTAPLNARRRRPGPRPWQNLRKAGIRYADLRGFSYCREDVSAKSLANEYSTVLASVFTREMKPLEVEILVVSVDETQNSLYQILYDGSVTDHERFVSIGGEPDDLRGIMRDGWRDDMPLADAVRLGSKALEGAGDDDSLDHQSLEIATLDRRQEGRRFRRLEAEEIRELLSG